MSQDKSGEKSKTTAPFPSKIVLGLAVGVAIGVAGTVALRPSFEDGRADAYAEIRARLVERGVYDAETAGETMFLSGTLVSREGSVLTVMTSEIPRDPLAPDAPGERRVTVTKNTKVLLQRLKPDNVLEAERNAYLEEQQRLSAEVGPESDAPYEEPVSTEEPSPTDFEEISLDDLAEGVALEIHADHDILFEEAFVATKIYVTEKVAIPDDAPEEPSSDGANLPLPADDAVVPPSATAESSEEAPPDTEFETPTP